LGLGFGPSAGARVWMSLFARIDGFLAARATKRSLSQADELLERLSEREDQLRKDLQDIVESKKAAREQCGHSLKSWRRMLQGCSGMLEALEERIAQQRTVIDRVSMEIESEKAVLAFDEELRSLSFTQHVAHGDNVFVPWQGGDDRNPMDRSLTGWDVEETLRYVKRARKVRDFFTKRLLDMVQEREQVLADAREIARRICGVAEDVGFAPWEPDDDGDGGDAGDHFDASRLSEISELADEDVGTTSDNLETSLECGNFTLFTMLAAAAAERTEELERLLEHREALQLARGSLS